MIDSLLPNNVTVINNRYDLRKSLGAGGMGTVYRAFDRLTQHEVALKRVLLDSDTAVQELDTNLMSTRLALANEFQLLASLHHPNIIRVLDYGFDTENHPYFTMSLLENAQTITKFAFGKPLNKKIDLLIELLQAMAYMHRRNIIHRDLKPENVLVDADGEVQVLDFGVAIAQNPENSDEIAGTIAYLAPEVLQGTPVSRASDMYSVGMLAYEIIAGHHPYDTSNAQKLLTQILMSDPDTDELDVPMGVANVVALLTNRDPIVRMDDAYEIIEFLSGAIDQPMPQESVAIRDSYIQAAQFIGRDRELNLLLDALVKAVHGHGSTWIVGGESGVGKSRLVSEIRTQALVRGTLVLQGQAIAEGGLPYQMWREPLRRLILSSDLDDLDASVLKQIIPDIGVLLNRDIEDAPPLEGRDGQQRLLETIAKMFRSQQLPVVLILEGLQWETDSLDVLKYLTDLVHEIRVLIIGSYRDDEAPNLSSELPGASSIKLGRLDESGIEQLSSAMLGSAGMRPEVIELLQRETEGNVFFLVEVVRALAEDAGSLNRIGLTTLPATIFSGGVQQIVQKRLDHVPADSQHLLRVAAISGRELNLAVLKAFDPSFELNDWLVTCSNVAVFESVGERWQFAHDKLREGVLNALDETEKRELHIRVAHQLQEIYQENVREYAALISNHYDQGNDWRQACYWYGRAAKQAEAVYSPETAIKYYQRALTLYRMIDEPIQDEHSVEYFELLFGLARQHNFQLNADDALRYVQRMIEEADEQEATYFQIEGRRYKGYLEFSRGKNVEALEYLSQGEELARQTNEQLRLADILWLKGWCVARGGDLQSALAMGEEVLQICADLSIDEASENRQAQRIKGQAANLVALVYVYTGQYDKAMENYEAALEMQNNLGEKDAAMATTNNIGWLAMGRGDYDLAIQHYDEAIQMAQDAGRQVPELIYRGNRGGALVALESYQEAVTELEELLTPAELIRLPELAEICRFLAEAYLGLQKVPVALESAHRSLTLTLEMKNPEYIGAAWRVLAQVAAVTDERIDLEIEGESKPIEASTSFANSEQILGEANILTEHAQTLKHWAIYQNLARIIVNPPPKNGRKHALFTRNQRG